MNHSKNKKILELNKVEIWDGNTSNAQALRQAGVDVMSAYPITPSTATVEGYAKLHADGYIDGEIMIVESEHAAMSGCVGASAAGARTATATASQGLALMIEVLYQAAGMRTPVVLCLVNRALAAPLNVNGDHSDMYLTSQSGWISLGSCNPEEAYDMTLCAFKIGEHKDVRLPVISNQDGFMSSHTAQNVRPLSDEVVADFIGEFVEVNSLLNFDHPVTHGVQTESDWHMEHKAKQNDAMMNSPKVIKEVFAEYEKLSGRKYNLVEEYKIDDADIVIACMGTTYETAQIAVDKLRIQGTKVGLILPRVFRPFPLDEMAAKLQNCKAVVCLDRSSPGGHTGLLFNDISAALINTDARPLMSDVIYGLGGRDITVADICDIYRDANDEVKAGKLNGGILRWATVRGPELKYYGTGV
ncbi:MAG: 2-oxoacid:ferredoxin oxidoreductase subunit alpha [Epsilonproteobacteria bacterium]|nr:MAG: 2-oxoacid:ferredoxin oxidoreductase subunit alpha [Campylobacterota bacterium]